jgi:hypothetical protein
MCLKAWKTRVPGGQLDPSKIDNGGGIGVAA